MFISQTFIPCNKKSTTGNIFSVIKIRLASNTICLKERKKKQTHIKNKIDFLSFWLWLACHYFIFYFSAASKKGNVVPDFGFLKSYSQSIRESRGGETKSDKNSKTSGNDFDPIPEEVPDIDGRLVSNSLNPSKLPASNYLVRSQILMLFTSFFLCSFWKGWVH